MMVDPRQCWTCKHHRGKGRCAAFPEFPGIPQDIYEMEFDHRQPHPQDNGIRWEPKVSGTVHPFDEDEADDVM